MILGEYPCCGGELALPLSPDPLPRFQKEECPHCGSVCWHRHSWLEPRSWTEAAFLAEFEVDPESRQLKPRQQPQKEQS